MPTSEPTAWGGAITALFVAGIPLLRAFGVNISEDQSNAILGFLAAFIVVGTLVLRNQVVPLGKAENAVEDALNTAPEVNSGAQAKDIVAGNNP